MARSGQLNATDYAVLATAKIDVDTLGRIRTSSEVHGENHLRRGHMLASMRRLEMRGFVARRGHSWSSGRITQAGRNYLANHTPPPKRGAGRPGAGGLAADGGTRFKHTLIEINAAGFRMSLGEQNHKLGAVVAKGRHKGRAMRAVTLEEGRTCPAECALRPNCYGGGMPFAKRLAWRGEATAKAIAEAIRAAGPVLVRLHTLGDFPSFQYAERILKAIAAGGGAAFGFTHHAPESRLGDALRRMAAANWDRFSIRTSYLHGTRKPIAVRSAVVVEHPDQAKDHNAIVCPEQLGKVESCAKCGFCWHSQRPVAFVLHENLARVRTAPPEVAQPLRSAA